MTTITQFMPSITGPFQFSPTLDGQTYNAVVTFQAAFGRRFYLNLFALDGTRILTTAMVGSPSAIALQSLSWSAGKVTAAAIMRHGFRVGSLAVLNVAGATPVAYNGQFSCMAVGPQTFTYLLPNNPGMATVFGSFSKDINLIGGVPNADGLPFQSSLVFRAPSRQFEVNP